MAIQDPVAPFRCCYRIHQIPIHFSNYLKCPFLFQLLAFAPFSFFSFFPYVLFVCSLDVCSSFCFAVYFLSINCFYTTSGVCVTLVMCTKTSVFVSLSADELSSGPHPTRIRKVMGWEWRWGTDRTLQFLHTAMWWPLRIQSRRVFFSNESGKEQESERERGRGERMTVLRVRWPGRSLTSLAPSYYAISLTWCSHTRYDSHKNRRLLHPQYCPLFLYGFYGSFITLLSLLLFLFSLI